VIDSEDGSAGGLITLVLVIILAGIMYLLVGGAIDKIIMVGLKLFSGSGASQMRYDTINLLLLVFRAEPLVVLLGVGINHWVNALREYSGGVSLSGMAIAVIEMMIGTVIMVAITLFGGAAIDLVIASSNGMTIMGANPELYSAVQYTGPIFYGFCLLITIGLVIQFVITCVSVADYSQLRGVM